MKEKLKSLMQKPISKVAAFAGALGSGLAGAMTAHAEGTVTDGAAAAQTLMNTMAQTLNLTNMVTIITAGIGAVLALYLGWWGARKLTRMLMGVFNKGRIKF